MIINLLNTIQYSVNNSLFAEGSTDEKDFKKHIIKAIKLILILLIPAILIINLFGGYVLQAFGKEFSTEGFMLLKLLSFSVIFTSINGALSSILNVKGKVNYILLMCIIGPSILMSFVYFTLPHGLISLGIGWLVGEAIIALIYLIIVVTKIL
jgi:O-antigen/teichoic acid export membrane protein